MRAFTVSIQRLPSHALAWENIKTLVLITSGKFQTIILHNESEDPSLSVVDCAITENFNWIWIKFEPLCGQTIQNMALQDERESE